jgi:hypothetical protein
MKQSNKAVAGKEATKNSTAKSSTAKAQKTPDKTVNQVAAPKNPEKAKTANKGNSSKNKAPQPAPASKAKQATKPASAQPSKSNKPSKEVSSKKNTTDKTPPKVLAVTSATSNALTGYWIHGEYIGPADAAEIAKLDLKRGKVSTTADYASKNCWQYYVGINSWLHIVADEHKGDPANMTARSLLSLIRTRGLIETIAMACAKAQALIGGEQGDPNMDFLLIPGDMRGSLQCLRFLKRFTCLEPNVLYDKALSSWLSVEKKTKRHNLRTTSVNSKREIYLKYIRSYLLDWFHGYVPVKCDQIPELPSGATYEKEAGMSLTVEDRLKQYALAAREPNSARYLFVTTDYDYKKTGVAVKCVSHPTYNQYCEPIPNRNRKQDIIVRKNRLVQVPKTYKTPRTVCPESPINQIMQKAIRDRMLAIADPWFKQHMPIRDQTIMEKLAAVGVRLGLATVDLSHASDSLALRDVLDAYPLALRNDLDRWRPTHTDMPDGTVHRLEQFSTMGTGNTWFVMGGFLLAAMRTACELAQLTEERYNGCFAFGDDCILPEEVVDTFYEILRVFNFEVNVDKSFGQGSNYRESCGSEWLDLGDSVISLRTLYYPRFPIEVREGKPFLNKTGRDFDPATGKAFVTDTMSRFTALQHATYYSHPSTSDFLAQLITKLDPKMTMSIAGSVCDDLWGPFSTARVKKVSHLYKTVPNLTYEAEGRELRADERLVHYAPTVVVDQAKGSIVEEYKYLHHLVYGPSSSDPLLELLGVSERQRLPEYKSARIKWSDT